MPKQGQRAEINSFVKGLITEASELNFPADAFSDAENFELNRNGTINRRLGLDYEPGHISINSGLTETNISSSEINTFRWLAAGGDVNKDFLVVQLGATLFFFDLATEPLSGGYAGQTTLVNFSPSVRYSFAALEGRLAVVSGADTVALVTYPGFGVGYERILTRDVWGIEEAIAQLENDPSFRTIVDNIHYYNLQNQSWGIPRKDQLGNLFDPVFRYQIDLGVGPSNSEQVWPGLQFQAVAPGQDPFERMYTNLYSEVLGATTTAPKGYFIIDALRRGQSREEQFNNNKTKYPELTGFAAFHTDLTEGGPTCVTDFAGRVFYAGFNGTVIGGDARSPEYTNYVFFSQVVKNRKDFFKCYQEGDPTSRENADLVDTDGGFLRVSGAKNIIALRNLETSLIIFATNGVWSATGGSDFGFSATNYKVTKISSFGALSESSIVVEGGQAFYWSEDGIYTIGRNELGDLGVTNITVPTIQSYFEAIPNISKLKAIGTYDTLTKKVRWIIKDGTPFEVDSETLELVFDSALNAFSVNRIMNRSEGNAEVFSLLRASPFVIGASGENVFVSSNQVLSNTEEVVIPSNEIRSGLQTTKYLILQKSGSIFNFSFGEFNNRSFADWSSLDGIGVDAKAFGFSGVQTAGDSAVKKQIPYLVIHMYRTETGTDAEGTPLNQSGCRVRYQWNFSNNATSKKFTTMFQVYRYVKTFIPANPGDAFDNGFSILTTKNKVRGMGRAFQMYFETEPGKDCRIVGWSLTVNGNSVT